MPTLTLVTTLLLSVRRSIPPPASVLGECFLRIRRLTPTSDHPEVRDLVPMASGRAPAVWVSTESTSLRKSVSRITSKWSIAVTSVSTQPCVPDPVCVLTVSLAMVLTDNKVALRQLELANAALLSGPSVHSYAGKSIAKDGKFHPRVLTLVSFTFTPPA